MRTYIVLATLLLLSTAAHAQLGGMNMPGGVGGRAAGQGRSGGHRRQPSDEIPGRGPSELFLAVDEVPVFPGDSLQNFLDHNIRYPEQARKDSVEGRVVIMMIVHRDGSHDTPDIVRSSGNDELDAEALRVVALMPKWVPGRIADKDVDSYGKVPVVFSLK
jgi:TonB family protein